MLTSIIELNLASFFKGKLLGPLHRPYPDSASSGNSTATLVLDQVRRKVGVEATGVADRMGISYSVVV